MLQFCCELPLLLTQGEELIAYAVELFPCLIFFIRRDQYHKRPGRDNFIACILEGMSNATRCEHSLNCSTARSHITFNALFLLIHPPLLAKGPFKDVLRALFIQRGETNTYCLPDLIERCR